MNALRTFAAIVLLALLTRLAPAAVSVDFVVDLQATVAPAAPPHISLSWTQRLQGNITSQKIHRRLKGETAWVLLATLANTATTYADPTALPGVDYEYWMERRFTGIFPDVAIGYLSAGVNLPLVEDRGVLLLVVDNTMTGPLAPELAQWKADLVGDGWTVQTIPVARTATPPSVRTLIQAAYNADPLRVKAVALFGRVPVPYAGLLAPDGHVPDHYGAWPADVYYGDMDGVWTDTSTNNTGASGTRQDNVPGDGKFDATVLPSDLELQVGRVDLSNMTKAPTAAISETALLRRYLRRAHDFRHRLGAYANVPRRSMMRDGFGHAFSSEPFAASGWAAAYACVSRSVDQPASGQWFTQATNNTYLWAYGCGGGGYESASSVGTSTDFGTRPSRAVFTALFGSYHGDWDSSNNFMRAVLAGNARGDSLGLACFWAGRPQWFIHPCGMGETLGYPTRLSQNNSGDYTFTGSSPHFVHLALMGDPALRLHMVQPPRNLAAKSAGGQVTIEWDASTETGLLGYHVYRAPTVDGPFTRLTATPLATTTFIDTTPGIYMVRTLKRETTPGGTYQNLSHGVFVSPGATFNPSALTAQALSSTQTQLAWTDNTSDETGFRIERKVNAAGSFVPIGSVGANAVAFTDPGPLTSGNVYFYRVVAMSAAGDSEPSNEAFADGFAGIIEMNTARQKVSRSAATASVVINRIGGITGTVAVTGTTTETSAIAGTHYTPFNGPINFPDGSATSVTVPFPLLNNGQPQLPRMFKLSITAPTNGASLGTQASTRVLIEDPTATLPAPWQQIVIGTVADSSPAVFAEGAFGSALIAGSMSTSDNGRFIYQARTGDGVLTAFIDAPLIAQNGARFAAMIRGSNTDDSVMASALVAGDTTGTNLATRTVTDGALTLLPGTNNNLKAPRWVRLTRSGNTFTAETSTNGSTFTLLGTSSVTLPAAANWGLFHSADAASSDYQLARFRYVTLTPIGALATPTSLTATPLLAPARINLAWDPLGGATGYRLERRAKNGVFTLRQTLAAGATSFADTTVLPGVIYEYRLQAFSGLTNSAFTSVVTATAPGSPTPYQQWLQTNNLPMDASGEGAPTAVLAGDDLENALKYALGLPPRTPGHGGRLASGRIVEGGETYLSLTYQRPEPAPAGVGYLVESGSDLSGWSTASTVEVSNTAAAGVRTITIRDTAPTAPRFMRLRVSVP